MTGFELTLRRKMYVILLGTITTNLNSPRSHYIITYYFPAGMFVIVSWISFLVPPESVPGRMTILVTVFLVLVNIFNSITSNIPRADGLTAIESFIIVCIVFVFGALIGMNKFVLSGFTCLHLIFREWTLNVIFFRICRHTVFIEDKNLPATQIPKRKHEISTRD